MANTYLEIQAQIVKLQAEAEKLRREERFSVIERIKVAIENYGLTRSELFGNGVSNHGSMSKSKIDTTPRFGDSAGNTWVGRGPRPQWLRDALAGGRELADFAIDRLSSTKSAVAIKVDPVPTKWKAEKRFVAVKYRDGSDAWSGRGSRPKWLTAAIEGGRKIEQFQV
jgi:DNA-binding protein H-NS